MNNGKEYSNSISIHDVEATEKLILKLKELSSFVIDTSSLIYMQKISVLEMAAGIYLIKAPLSVINEFGSSPEGITAIDVSINADDDLLLCAKLLSLPVCSEDKKVLMHARRDNIDYYNTVMILISMLAKEKISRSEFDQYVMNLRSKAHYSKKVWDYAQNLIETLNEREDK
ncbi:MAG: hypothetical protein PF637_04800 [Spirochaetes bacterium]|nr:hypothetical protein [Spirochaetota bacterium]